MSNFNDYFRKTGAKIIVDRFFTGIDQYTKEKLTDLTFTIEEEDKPASYYIENGLTVNFKVKLKYDIDYDGKDRFSEFEVPKEVDGTFIIEGAYRVATNNLCNDTDCRIIEGLDGKLYVNFDYYRQQYDVSSKLLTIRPPSTVLGVMERPRVFSLDQIDELTGKDRELLKLTERQSKKLQIKLNLDYYPEYISKKLIEDCVAYGDDRIRDLVIDKKIESVPAGFMEFLFKGSNNRNYNGVKRKIRNYWTQNHVLQDQISTLTMLCYRHWKGSSDSKGDNTDLVINPGLNPLNTQALKDKIHIPTTIAYNKTFTDIICIGDTPINQNVNQQNSLTVSTHVKDDGEILFDVYDLKFNKITINYLDYLNSKVCASENVDYENKKMVPDEKGNVVCKYRLKKISVPTSEIELIDLHPDCRLSETTRRIPFVNYTDSVRIHMGSGMLKQSIPLVNAERPIVDTGNKEELHNNVLNDKFREEKGKVKDITESDVVVELPDGKEVKYPRRTAIQSVNRISVYTEPKVKIGQTIKKGDTVNGSVGLEEDTYKMGINTLVLFHAMFGYVNEDALVVSESYADKMRSYSILDLDLDITLNEVLKDIVPIGTVVKSKDTIVTLYRNARLNDVNRAVTEKLGGLFGDSDEFTISHTLKVPNNVTEATVSDIMILPNKHKRPEKNAKPPDYTLVDKSELVFKEYPLDRKIIYEKFPEYIAADRLKPINLEDKGYKTRYVLRVRLIMKTKLMVGSKLTNRYGGKGVISKVLPDNQMPVMVDDKGKKSIIDCVMNPYSTINRKIPSVNMESMLGKIAHRIHDIVEEYKNDPTKMDKIMPLMEKYYPGRYSNLTVSQFIKLHNSNKLEDVYYFNVGSYSTKFKPELINEWAKELGVTSQSRILIPSNTVADLKELKENLDPVEYEEAVKGMTGKYVEIDKPLTVGWIMMEELYQIPVYSSKATSSMFGTDVDAWRDSPILGRGAYRTTGQKIGEMELSALLARGAYDFIQASRSDTVKTDNQVFLNNLLGLGLTVTDSKGYNQGGSSRKTKIEDMKVKFRRKKLE